jgi:hypothetical protein
LNRRNRCSWPTPRLKECRHIFVVGNRQKQLAHAPKGIWGIGERIAADCLDARTNLNVPLARKCWRDGGEDAEICSKVQGACRVRGGKDPLDLCADSFTREAGCQRGVPLDRRGGTWLYLQVKARNEPDRAQHAQRIFHKAFRRITNRTEYTVGQVLSSAMRINDRAIGDWIGTATRLRGETKRDRVDREVATSKIALDTREEGDLVRSTGVATAAICAEGGDLANYAVAGGNADGAKSILVGGVWEECTQLIWRRLGGEIPIGRHSPSNHIANGAADNIGAKSCGAKCAQEVSNVARDGGANRRRWGHAPLAAALSEIKRNSRHAE